ncbi:FUSC family protein [Microbacterium sp. NPDC089189]|uniref:FUSC family protein n=1 Tax=Microbacterium sp. NPDC089189 TaxID=3154972 RepID=UPI0034436673
MTTPARRAAAATAVWARALVHEKHAPILWGRVGLAAAGIAAPVGLALLLAPTEAAVVGAGSLASMGALVATTMDSGSARVLRVRRMALGSTLAAVGFAVGTAVHGHTVMTFVVVVLASLLSGVSGAVSATASRSAVSFLIFTVTAANADFGLHSPWIAPLIFFLGAVWRLLLTVVTAAYADRDRAPERHAVARVYRALADQLEAPTAESAQRASLAVTAALNDADDVLRTARTARAVRDPRWRVLVSAVNASAPLVDAAIAAGDRIEPRPDGARMLRHVALWVENPARPRPTLSPTEQDPVFAAAFSHLTRALRPDADPDLSLPSTPTATARIRSAARALIPGTDLWGSVLRLVLCMSLAQALCLWWRLDHPYIVVLTVAQVMKPDLGSVFARAVQRGAGTLVGVAIGSLAIVIVPRDGWQLLLIVVLAAGVPLAMPRNYGLYSMVTTPLAVLLVEIHAGHPPHFLENRLLETVLGSGIVLLVGYLPWPATWRAPRRVAHRVADLIRSVSSYVDLALRRPGEDDRAMARRDLYRQISDVRTQIAASAAEPPAISAAAMAWLPEVSALERVTDAVTATATDLASAGGSADPGDVDAVRRALDDLAAAADTGRDPGAFPIGATPLRTVAQEIALARAALRFPNRRPGDAHARASSPR